MTSKPDLILVPNTGVNRSVVDLNAAYGAAVWDVPVLDLNSPNRELPVEALTAVSRIAIATRTFAVHEAKLLAGRVLAANPASEIGYLAGPVDVLCCYRYERADRVFSVPVEYGDGLPLPGYDRFDCIDFLATGWRSGSLRYPLMTSLGCPFGCQFCMARRRAWRPRSAAHCVAEITEAVERWQISGFQILDDCFNLEEERVLSFCEQVGPLRLSWECNNGLRADRFSREQAEALAEAGCHHVTFGVETSDEALLASIGKGETVGQIGDAIDWAQGAGLQTAGFFLVGLPGSSREIDERSLEWANGKGIEPHFSYFVPPERWQDGAATFWGEDAKPLSDAYEPEQQRQVIAAARGAGDGVRDRFGVVRNTAAMGLQRAVNLVAFALLTPFLLKTLGEVGYGVFILGKLIVLIGALATPDFGGALPYFLPRFLARRRTAEARQALRSAWTATLALAVVVPVVVLAALTVFQYFWRAADAEWLLTVRQVVSLGAVAATLTLLARYSMGVLSGLHRLDLSAMAATVSCVLGSAATAFCAWRWGIVGAASGMALHAGAECLLAGALAGVLVRRRALRSGEGARRPTREMLHYVSTRWVTRAEEAGIPAVDKMLIASWLTMPILTVYHVANGVTTFCRDLPGMLSAGLVPWIARVGHSDDPEDQSRLNHVYDLVNRAVVLLKIGLFAFLLVNAKAVFELWLDREASGELLLAIRLLAVSSCITTLSDLPTVACVALGRPQLQMRCAAFQFITNVALSVALLPFLGFSGILVGSVVAWSLSAIILLVAFRKLGLVQERRNPFVVAAHAFLVAVGGAWLARGASVRLVAGAFSQLVVNGGTFALGVVFLAWLSHYVLASDWRFAAGTLRMVLKRGISPFPAKGAR